MCSICARLLPYFCSTAEFCSAKIMDFASVFKAGVTSGRKRTSISQYTQITLLVCKVTEFRNEELRKKIHRQPESSWQVQLQLHSMRFILKSNIWYIHKVHIRVHLRKEVYRALKLNCQSFIKVCLSLKMFNLYFLSFSTVFMHTIVV